MIPEPITLRVVVVCNAVNRSGVSSSSSGSVFEVLRESQILGGDRLKATLPGTKAVKELPEMLGQERPYTHGENNETHGNTLHAPRTASSIKKSLMRTHTNKWQRDTNEQTRYWEDSRTPVKLAQKCVKLIVRQRMERR